MIENNEDLRELVKGALENAKPFSFKQIVDFKEEELTDLNQDQILDKIMLKIRPDTSNMDRAEVECLNSMPDWIIENDLIDSIEIEYIEKSEATFEPRFILSIYTNEKYETFMNEYYEE